MTRLLLDFPWQIASVLDRNADGYFAFYQFERLCEIEHLYPVPFVAEADYLALRDNPQYTGGSNLRATLQVMYKYIRETGGLIRAAPEDGPNDLSDAWKLALYDELHLNQWRTPQIIICKSRSDAWKRSMAGAREKTEVVLRCENCGEEYRRVIAVLESYEHHLLARSDRDPWDLQRWKIPAPGAPAHQRHPCSLPKPPGLNYVKLEDVRGRLVGINTWEIGGRYYFLPRADWNPLNILQMRWREGRTFPRGDCPHCDRSLPVDRNNHVWCWDQLERHWDVQFRNGEEYWSISHNGAVIKKTRRSKKKRKGHRRK